MHFNVLLAAAVALASTLLASQAEEIGGGKLAPSIPDEILFCARLELNTVRQSEGAKSILDATQRRFTEQLDAMEQFCGLNLDAVDCVWVGVVKDEEALVILEGHFDAELILNSPAVTHSKRLARPGTLIALEVGNENKEELSHAVLLNERIVAFGRPRLVDQFVSNYVDRRSGWDQIGLGVLDSLAASESMIHVAILRLPEQELMQKPFLAAFVNAQLSMKVDDVVSLTAHIAMQDEAKAAALRDLISGIVGLGLTSEIKGAYPEIQTALLAALKLSHEGRTVLLSSGMDAALLRAFLRTQGLMLP